jgi:hypothetical protein
MTPSLRVRRKNCSRAATDADTCYRRNLFAPTFVAETFDGIGAARIRCSRRFHIR